MAYLGDPTDPLSLRGRAPGPRLPGLACGLSRIWCSVFRHDALGASSATTGSVGNRSVPVACPAGIRCRRG